MVEAEIGSYFKAKVKLIIIYDIIPEITEKHEEKGIVQQPRRGGLVRERKRVEEKQRREVEK